MLHTLPRQSEKRVQAQIVSLIQAIGGQVNVIGRPSPKDGRTHRGTGQTPGLPDLYAFLPLRVDVPMRGVWIEVKAAGGKLRPEQRLFMEMCHAAGVPHILGGVDQVVAYLQAGGWVKADAAPMARTA
jgi:hypothetical protein